MELFLARCFDALANGSVYALIALALVLIFKATTLINFAQGEFAMLGAFFVLVVWKDWGLWMWLAVPLAMVISALFAAGAERVLIRPFDPADHLPLVIITLGLFLAINSVAGIIWRFDPWRFPALFPSGNALEIGNATLTWYAVFTVLTTVATVVLLHVMLTRTKVGLAFRAVSSNLESSQLTGIRVGPTLQFGWALAAAVGTLGAAVYAADPIRQLEPTIMLRVLIFAVTAAAIGGLDSIWGTLVGGLSVGAVQSLLVPYTPIPNELNLLAAVIVLLVVLSFKPAGFFGTASVERV